MTLDDIGDAEWFLQRNPPLYALMGDFFEARTRPEENKLGSREELAQLQRHWRM